ncbi:MAG: DUF6232 family protein [Granulosicoccus sp.]
MSTGARSNEAVLPDNVILFSDEDIRVTPTWLQIEDSSHAVSHIVRLSLNKIEPPRITATAVFFVSLLLIVFSGLHLLRESLPVLVAWMALIASLVLMLFAAWHAFVATTIWKIEIGFQNAGTLVVARKDSASASQLHQAVARALDWHQGGSVPRDS